MKITNLVERVWWALTVNDVVTDGSPPYPDLIPLHTKAVPDTVWAQTRKLFDNQPNWHIDDINRNEHTLTGTAQTNVLGITDDLTMWLSTQTNQPEHATTIMARSQSRIGKGDLGQNARRLGMLQSELRRRLPVIN